MHFDETDETQIRSRTGRCLDGIMIPRPFAAALLAAACAWLLKLHAREKGGQSAPHGTGYVNAREPFAVVVGKFRNHRIYERAVSCY